MSGDATLGEVLRTRALRLVLALPFVVVVTASGEYASSRLQQAAWEAQLGELSAMEASFDCNRSLQRGLLLLQRWAEPAYFERSEPWAASCRDGREAFHPETP